MRITLLLIFGLISSSAFGQHRMGNSPYAGQQERQIKSLSQDDIDQIKAGKGWGLAKMAELNGYPGPSHVLELANELDLSSDKKVEVEKLFTEMQSTAIEKGEAFLKAEQALEDAFQSGEIDHQKLEKLIRESALKRGELRMVHLEAHLKMMEILSVEQIEKYNELRGYSTMEDPCENIPEGHNPEMWKKHNGCNR